MKKPLLFARKLVTGALKHGDLAVDATCGNGHDTLFLAGLVGQAGRVLAFDIQEEAIVRTRERLSAAGVDSRVTLIRHCHAGLAEHLDSPVGAVMFNLGYLPGGDHSTVTGAETTLPALRAALAALNRGGVITLIVYTGHPGGKEEYEALVAYAVSLPQQEFTVLEYRFINQANNPPLLLAITRL